MSTLQKDQQLRVKSFFAASIQEAMAEARRELGPDALLLNSREAPPEARHLGEYEIVFAGSAAPLSNPPAGLNEPTVADLCDRVDEIRELLTRCPPGIGVAQSRTAAIHDALVDAGIDAALAQEIEADVRQRIHKRSVPEIGRPRPLPEFAPELLVSETISELNSRFDVKPEIGRITALVGPPGCGKTTALVKLAVVHGLMAGRPVRIFSADNQRIAAVEQLRTYAAILGVPFEAVDGAAALAHAIDAAPSQALLLIDTPGYSAAMLQDVGSELAGFLSSRQDIDIHLVLTASMRQADLRRTTDLFEVFNFSSLLFTKLDETTSYAGILCESARRKRPLSFFCHGQSIPEDIEPASKQRVIDSLVRQLPEALQAAA